MHWKGYDDVTDTWEEQSNLRDVPAVIEKYWREWELRLVEAKASDTVIKDLQGELECPRFHNEPERLYRKRYKISKQICFNVEFRTLYVHNWVFVSRLLNMSYCFLWSEYDAKRGALEIISITRKWLSTFAAAGVRRLIFWGDNCSAQNKNWLFFFFVAFQIYQGQYDDIDLKFLLKGHSWMRADGVFGHINNKARQATVELPREYINIVNEAGSVATYMNQEEFVDMSAMLHGLFTQRKTDVTNTPLDNITTYAWYRYIFIYNFMVVIKILDLQGQIQEK